MRDHVATFGGSHTSLEGSQVRLWDHLVPSWWRWRIRLDLVMLIRKAGRLGLKLHRVWMRLVLSHLCISLAVCRGEEVPVRGRRLLHVAHLRMKGCADLLLQGRIVRVVELSVGLSERRAHIELPGVTRCIDVVDTTTVVGCGRIAAIRFFGPGGATRNRSPESCEVCLILLHEHVLRAVVVACVRRDGRVTLLRSFALSRTTRHDGFLVVSGAIACRGG